MPQLRFGVTGAHNELYGTVTRTFSWSEAALIWLSTYSFWNKPQIQLVGLMQDHAVNHAPAFSGRQTRPDMSALKSLMYVAEANSVLQ